MPVTISARVCVFCLVFVLGAGAANQSFAQQTGKARPDGLDGVAVARAPAPDPLQYATLRENVAALLTKENYAEAEPLTDRLVQDYAIDGHNWLMDGDVKRHLGKFREAADAYRHAITLLGPGVPGRAEYFLGMSEAAAGDKEGALKTLAHLVDEDHYLFRPSLYDDAAFSTLRSDPRFEKIAGRFDQKGWTRTQGWRHDIDYLAAEIVRVNPDFHDRPLPAVFQRLHKQLWDAVPKLSDEQIYAGMSRLLASMNQGHANLWPFIQAKKLAYSALPLQFYVFPEGIFVVGAGPGYEDMIGSELVAIEKTPALDALKKIGDIHAADSGMEVDWLGPRSLVLAQELKGLGIVSRTDRITLTLRTRSGSVVTRDVVTGPGGTAEKLHASPGKVPALSVDDTDKSHWFAPLPESQTMYVQVNRILDDRDETLTAFGLRLRKALQDPAIHNVILDLRHDNGGNTFTYVELLRTLIGFSQEDGRKLYVIIDRGVYSAAGNLATDLDRLASPIFVGEPTAMTGNNYGDESEFELPYSGIHGAIAGVKWQLGYPDDRRRAIVPDVPVSLSAADYFAGRDPALEAVKALCARASAKQSTPD